MDNFIFTSKQKQFTFGLMAVGVVALILAIVGLMGAEGHEAHHTAAARLWSNLLICSYYFVGMSVTATFFMALQHAAESGWATMFKRVMEAMGLFLPVGAILLIIAIAGGNHYLYHWMDADAVAHDELLQHKSAYLNLPFFWIRTIVYLGVWILFTMWFRKLSIQEDSTVDPAHKIHFKLQRVSVMFMVFFGYTSSTSSWDWIMSIDAHWFSTLFGWYAFSGTWLSALIMMTLIIIWLKSKGYLPKVNDNHIHDMGKWIFGVSCLWTYLWFSQFMLIWYANIPEEVTYFQARFADYKFIYFFMIIMNFVLPFFVLMDKDMKRKKGVVAFVGVILLVFHWLDVYLCVTPGVMKDHWNFGFIEIGMFIGFTGLFLFVVLRNLTKQPLIVKNHPFLDECIHFEQN